MATFAIVENGVVINTIISDSKSVAESVTGKTCIEYTTEPAEIGGTYINNVFTRVKPYPSWVTDGNSGWKPPVDRPNFNPENPKEYIWDESIVDWIEKR